MLVCRGCGRLDGKGHESSCQVRMVPCDASWVEWAEREAYAEEADRVAVYHRPFEEFDAGGRRLRWVGNRVAGNGQMWDATELQVWSQALRSWLMAGAPPEGHRLGREMRA